MINVTEETVHAVNIIESERGWGQKVDEVKYFATKPEAEQFVKTFNAQNDKDYVPDWYMYADYAGPVKVVTK